ncbi:MAG: hypothetical protein ACYS8W_11395 [Planctomycetota bacterium]|jgi:hypothetical protein
MIHNKNDLELSAKAFEELFRMNMGQWSLAVGIVNFSNMLGITKPRLKRMISTTSPTLDLGYRLHYACGLSWLDISVGDSPDSIAERIAGRERQPRLFDLDTRVTKSVQEARERLRGVVAQVGFEECWQRIGIARATLHSYLGKIKIPLSVIWRIHLITGIPFSEIITGAEEEPEKELREKLGTEADVLGSFSSIYEPIVQLVDICCRMEKSETAKPYIPVLKKLFNRNLSVAQKLNLTKCLILYYLNYGMEEKAKQYVKKEWRIIRDGGKGPPAQFLLLRHSTYARYVGDWEHSEKVANRVLESIDDPRITSQIYRGLSELELMRFDISRAFLYARKGIHIAAGADPRVRDLIIAGLKDKLMMCEWASGDYTVALSRAESLLNSPAVPLANKFHASEIITHVRIWLGDPVKATRAARIMRKFSGLVFNMEIAKRKSDLYRLRILILEKENGTLRNTEKKKLKLLAAKASKFSTLQMDSDMYCLWAICLFHSLDEKKHLKKILSGIIAGKRGAKWIPMYTLPDLFEAVKNAGLWSKKVENWSRAAMDKGLFVFDIQRPDI